MKFSLINVDSVSPDGTVCGSWLQDHIGTLETAEGAARRVAAANGNRIDVAVTDEVPGPGAILRRHFGLRRLGSGLPEMKP